MLHSGDLQAILVQPVDEGVKGEPVAAQVGEPVDPALLDEIEEVGDLQYEVGARLHQVAEVGKKGIQVGDEFDDIIGDEQVREQAPLMQSPCANAMEEFGEHLK